MTAPTTAPASTPGSGASSTGTRATRLLGIVTFASLVAVAAFGLLLSPADVVQGESVRILYMHVGTVWVAYLAFGVTAISSALYL